MSLRQQTILYFNIIIGSVCKNIDSAHGCSQWNNCYYVCYLQEKKCLEYLWLIDYLMLMATLAILQLYRDMTKF